MQTLVDNPVLLLMAVIGAGWTLGSVRVRGVGLGVTGVFFVGLAASALDPRLRLAEVVDQLGLVLFVYAVGLAAGPMFARALRQRGLRDNALTVAAIGLAAVLVAGGSRLLHLSAATAAGAFAGATVNLPALAAALDALHGASSAAGTPVDAVVACSLTYPFGVVSAVLAALALVRLVRPDFAAEAHAHADLSPADEEIVEQAVLITRGAGVPVQRLAHAVDGPPVLVSRLVREGRTRVAATVPALAEGDWVSLLGTGPAVAELAARLGERVPGLLSADRSVVDFRRISVSDRRLAGVRLGDLRLPEEHAAAAVLVRRGDVDMLASDDLELCLGDRVRVVAPREELPRIAARLGDSESALAQLDLRTLALGIAAGLLLGLVPVPVPGGGVLRLGLAGGPIVAGLVLGAVGRSGPLTWQLPRGALAVLRQLGVTLFFAGVGSRSGAAFADQVRAPGSLATVLLGTVVAVAALTAAMWVGYVVLRTPASILLGVLAGLGTNPAVLTLAEERSGSELPAVGYATVFPTAMLLKVLLGQLLVLWLR